MTGENLQQLHEVTLLVQALRMPFLILGDFNLTPNELPRSCLSALKGTVLTPAGATATCANGLAVLDYAVISPELEPAVELSTFTEGPWGAHLGLHLAISRAPRQFIVRTLAAPRPINVTALQQRRAITWEHVARLARDHARASGKTQEPHPRLLRLR